MNEIKISVIIPIYKVEKYLRQCIESVLNQTYRNIEVILVDDGSPDRCPDICDGYAKEDNRVKVIHKCNGGVSSARRSGMASVTGAYVMFVDGDDWIELSTIDICVDVIRKAPEVGCILFSYIKEYPDRSVLSHIMDHAVYFKDEEAEYKVYRRLYGLSEQELDHPERMENIVSCIMKLYRVDYARQGKYFDTKLVGSCEDGLFNMYALYNCDNIVYIDMPLYHYRKAGSSLTSSFRPQLIQQWKRLFSIMEHIIHEKKLGQAYKEALSNRIALSITAIGWNELGNPEHGTLGHIKVIRDYLKQRKYHNAVKNIKIGRMPFAWKIFMICCKLKCAVAVYAVIVAFDRINKR